MKQHNISRPLWTVLSGFVTLLLCQPVAADEPAGKPTLVDTSRSAKAQLRPVPLDAVRWTKGFWAERYDQSRDVTLRKLWDLAADPEAGHVLDNMRIAGGLKKGEFAGTDWQDAWLYKWIESAAAFYAITRDPWIEERMDDAIELIAAAQEDDGYIATQITARNKPRFTDPREHEVYSMGHLLTAACVHHRVTGKDSLLKVATRCGDFLCETLGVSVAPCYAHNPSAVMGLVELYRETGQRKYLDCAKMIVDRRGEAPKPGGLFYKEPGIAGTDLIQDRTPLRKSWEVVGHNVFFTYLYAGAADVYLENGDQTLWPPLDRLWNDLTQKKMCINGGVSPMGHGLSKGNDPVCEAVGPSYFLPCADCYNETCGQIGNLMWNYRMLCAKPDAKYADIMELELYNGFLAGIGLDGESWFYRNSLRFHDDSSASGRRTQFHVRARSAGSQADLLPDESAADGRRTSNLLLQPRRPRTVDSPLRRQHVGRPLADGKRLKLTQKTNYPWDGKIVISLEEVDSAEPFAIRVRIPGWATGATAAVNGECFRQRPCRRSVLVHEAAVAIGRRDRTEPADACAVDAGPSQSGATSQPGRRDAGPRALLSGIKGPAGGPRPEQRLHSRGPCNSTRRQPMTCRSGSSRSRARRFIARNRRGRAISIAKSNGMPMKPLPIRMIPYFAWANRGPAAMSVWLPVVWSK